MAERITATAEAIASALGTLPGVKAAYPFPKPMSQTQIGDLTLSLMGSSPPTTSGPGATQVVQWECNLALRSATSGDIEQVHQQMAELMSLDPAKSIIGKLHKDPETVAALRDFGDPFLDMDGEGIVVEYDVVAGDTIITLLRFTILANVEDSG